MALSSVHVLRQQMNPVTPRRSMLLNSKTKCVIRKKVAHSDTEPGPGAWPAPRRIQ